MVVQGINGTQDARQIDMTSPTPSIKELAKAAELVKRLTTGIHCQSCHEAADFILSLTSRVEMLEGARSKALEEVDKLVAECRLGIENSGRAATFYDKARAESDPMENDPEAAAFWLEIKRNEEERLPKLEAFATAIRALSGDKP